MIAGAKLTSLLAGAFLSKAVDADTLVRDHAAIYNLLGDPAQRVPFPADVAEIEAPETAKAGSDRRDQGDASAPAIERRGAGQPRGAPRPPGPQASPSPVPPTADPASTSRGHQGATRRRQRPLRRRRAGSRWRTARSRRRSRSRPTRRPATTRSSSSSKETEPRRRSRARGRSRSSSAEQGMNLTRKQLILVAAVCGGVTALGCLLPWVTHEGMMGAGPNFSGLNTSYGWIVFLAGIVAARRRVAHPSGQGRPAREAHRDPARLRRRRVLRARKSRLPHPGVVERLPDGVGCRIHDRREPRARTLALASRGYRRRGRVVPGDTGRGRRRKSQSPGRLIRHLPLLFRAEGSGGSRRRPPF